MATRPTKNPRIAFVPSDTALSLIRKLSKASGESMAQIVSGMVDTVSPVFLAQIQAYEQIASAPEQAKEIVQSYANKAVSDIAQASMEFTGKPPRKARAKNA